MLSMSLTYYACMALELLYPTYASFRALATADGKDDSQWLTYWVVYAFMSTIEALADVVIQWIPLYYEAKFLFVLWMITPKTNGAKFLFDNYITPFLRKYASKIDPVFERTQKALNSQMAGVVASGVDKYAPTMIDNASKFAQNATDAAMKAAREQSAEFGKKAE